RLIRLTRLTVDDIIKVIRTALDDPERGLDISIDDQAIGIIADIANGDARMALNLLEQAATINQSITVETLKEIVGERVQLFDKKGDNHYDLISALIKSMRGSDPDAAIHYLAKLINGGEDINFIARRIVICAAEDVGNAAPMALVLANAAAQAAQFVGLPEARIILAQAVTYIASAPKSNAAYLAIDAALNDVRSKDCGEVPKHLRDAHYKGAKALGHGKGYRYPHDFEDHFVEQQYLPTELSGTRYYRPTDNGVEAQLKERLKKFWRHGF
ncbi:MAG: replication-associated recombination protein A, partial [Selenomonadaceae bacterium]|nr:replication-associated recombination protein A [Selenomonadaceae bacterium]